jgi:ribonucleoside-diphosphate reductase alpha chain
VPEALRVLGYTAAEIADIIAYAVGRGTLRMPPRSITRRSVRGLHRGRLQLIEQALATPSISSFVFNKWTLGEEFCTGTLGFAADALADPGFDMLAELGFGRADIEAANTYAAAP